VADPVSCSFFDTLFGAQISQADILPATGLGGMANQLRTAALNFAAEGGATLFAIPDLVINNGSWLVFEVGTGRFAYFRAKAPSRDAAEMWMMHRGEKL